MDKGKLLITESLDFSVSAIDKLRHYYDVVIKDIKDEEELIDFIKDVDVIFIRLKFKISKTIIDKATSLKYILTATTGLDHVDIEYSESKKIQVISLKGAYEFLANIPSTAEHTWGLMLALIRYIPKSYASVKKGEWYRDQFKGHNLKSLKLGILGMGRVGVQVEAYAKAFGMDVGFYDVDLTKKSVNSQRFDTAVQLFEWADIISIHIPLNEDNLGFVSDGLLRCLGRNSYVINTSRGSVVDEVALSALIKENKLKGYATDVLADEIETDPIENPIVSLANNDFNVIITPHIAGCTYESMRMTEDFIVDAFLKKLTAFEKEE